jgi:NADPH:quinone reductase-like Zn-dependent oxidoreductase
MKAVFIERFGGPDVLRYGDLPDPVAGAGEVVIDLVAASVNGADWKMRRPVPASDVSVGPRPGFFRRG